MSVNLLDLAKGHLTDALIGKAASFLGESNEATKSGLDHALPALLGGLMSKAGSKSGASDLLGMITKPELGGNLLSNLDGLFGGSNSSLLDLGGTLLNSVFGSKLGGITDLIGSAAGLKSGSAAGLLKMALPMLMGVVGKKVGTSGVSGLLNLLGGQKDFLAKAAPAGFMDKMLGSLGVGSLDKLTNNFADVKGAVSGAAGELGKGVKKGGNKMLPLLGLLALAAIAFFAMRNCKGNTKDVTDTVDKAATEVKSGADKVVDGVKDGANAAAKGVKDAASAVVSDVNSLYSAGADLVGKTVKGFEYLGAFAKRKLKDGAELIVPSKGFEAQLIDFIEGGKEVDKTTWFNMRRVLFKTGSANLDERSMGQIDNVTKILKAYPNVHLKLGGYTDNTGNAAANKTLSANRATAVMKALIAKGIDASRLTAEGYGIEHPVADNATAEGRALNRRVAARVSKK